MTKNIAFFNIPSLGHIYPTLPVVTELVRRGHRVIYPGVPDRAELIGQTGAVVAPYQSSRPSDSDPGYRLPDSMAGSLLSFLTEAELTLSQLEESVLGHRPDLVVFDRAAFAGGIFARKHRIPALQLWPMLVPRRPPAIDPDEPGWVTYQVRLEKFLANQGVTADLLAPDVLLHVAFLPRAFQPDASRFGPEYEFVGPCLGARPDSWVPPPGPGEILLITLGSLNNMHLDFYQLCFEAFEGTGWHVVLPVGRRLSVDQLGPTPPNFEVVASVAQLEVLRHAKAFVSHAGLGGVLEAVSAGVPQVAIPRTTEQSTNAARVVDLGVGASLAPDSLTPAGLREVVEQVVADPAIAASVADLRRECIASGGTIRAADVIEKCLSS